MTERGGQRLAKRCLEVQKDHKFAMLNKNHVTVPQEQHCSYGAASIAAIC